VFACVCQAVTEDEVVQAVDAGADTLTAVSIQTSAGTGCGTCHEYLEELIELRCGTCPLASMSRVA
jgi:bacterioferritin-associated ferredoxin